MKNKNKPKVVFISPEDNVYGFGIRTLSSIIKKHGYESVMVFMPSARDSYSEDELKQLVSVCNDALAVCLTSTAYSFKNAVQIVKSLRSLDTPIIMGGSHATLNPEACLDHVDFVCIGEGDYAIVELLDAIKNGDKTFKTENLCYKRRGRVIKNKVRKLISDINCLPFPDYAPEGKLVLFNGVLQPLHEKHFSFGQHNVNDPFFEKIGPTMLYHTIRGCNYSCKYCYSHDFKKIYKGEKCVRLLAVNNIVAGLNFVFKTYPNLKFVWFTDDNFFVRDANTLKKLGRLYNRNIALPFVCNLVPNRDEQKLKILVSAGLKKVKVGVQTGSDYVNKSLYQRGMTASDVLDTADMLKKYDNLMYPPEYHIISTNPLERKEDILQTIRLVLSLPRPFTLRVFNLVFFPGSTFEKEYLSTNNKGIQTDFSKFKTNEHLEHLKKKNLKHVYLYALISFFDGYCSENAYGLINERYLKFLLNEKVIRLGEKLPLLSYSLAYTYLKYVKLRYFSLRAKHELSKKIAKLDLMIRQNKIVKHFKNPAFVKDCLFAYRFLEPETKSKCYFVIDSVYNNMCGGGIRIVEDDITSEEAKILAKNMTKKYSLAGIRLGGAKLCMLLKGDKKLALSNCGTIIKNMLRDKNLRYFPATDMGTTKSDLKYFIKYINSAHLSPSYTFVKSDFYTYIGIKSSINFLVKNYGLKKDETAIAIEGFGKVARRVAIHLYKERFKIIAISNRYGMIYDKKGLNIPSLLKNIKSESEKDILKRAGKKILKKENIFHLKTDILIPGGRVYAVNAKNCHKLTARFICPIANAPVSPDAKKVLQNRGVIILPDIITNIGGVLGTHYAISGVDKKDVISKIDEKVDSLLNLWQNGKVEYDTN